MPAIPGRDDFNEFLNLFRGESDRAAVVLGGAYLDACLEDTLRTWLADDVDVDEHFEPPNGVLSSYGAKYQLAHALGSLEDPLRADFKHIGAIRNHFAHHVLDATWANPKVQKHLRALRASTPSDWYPGSDRDFFLIMVSVLSGLLRSCEKEPKRKAVMRAKVRALEQLAKDGFTMTESKPQKRTPQR